MTSLMILQDPLLADRKALHPQTPRSFVRAGGEIQGFGGS